MKGFSFFRHPAATAAEGMFLKISENSTEIVHYHQGTTAGVSTQNWAFSDLHLIGYQVITVGEYTAVKSLALSDMCLQDTESLFSDLIAEYEAQQEAKHLLFA